MLLVFGSINVDFVYRVAKLPEPGETLIASDFQILPGGKGANQAVAAARAGAEVVMAGSVGSDPLASVSIDALSGAGVDVSAVVAQAGPGGTAAISVDDAGENSIVVASGANALTQADAISDRLLSKTTTVLLQMEIPHEENWNLLQRARQNHVCTILNLAPFAAVPSEAIENVDILICNEVEFRGLTALLGTGTPEIRKSLAMSGNSVEASIVVTLGRQGVLAVHKDELLQVPILPVDVVDTTGAGDAFCGAFAAAIDAQESFESALQKGSIAGGLACQKLGAQAAAPDHAAIEDALKDLGPTIRAG